MNSRYDSHCKVRSRYLDAIDRLVETSVLPVGKANILKAWLLRNEPSSHAEAENIVRDMLTPYEAARVMVQVREQN